MQENITVSQCYHGCPFFESGMDGMSCGHPHWKGKVWDAYIITQDNSHGRVPDKCPLRQGPTTIIKTVRLK